MTQTATHIIRTDSRVHDALFALNALSGESMTLFAVDGDGILHGTVTDGDIRRAFIAGATVNDSVKRVMNRNFLGCRPGDDLALIISKGRARHIDLLPVISTDGRLQEVVDLRKMRTSLPIDAVLMAGGRGERLRPLTENVPKPLLPVGGKPIIDYNVEELEACGVKNIYVTVNYLADQIMEHFDRKTEGCRVSCVKEPCRLGTMGSVALVDGLSHDNVLLMNSDLLTTLDFEAMYLHHVRDGADITIASVPYNVSVPFALMKMEGGRVIGLDEKPTYNYFANGGVYLIKRHLLSRLEKGEYMDAPDFIASVIKSGGNVGCFPIEGTWIDIGSHDDYRYANELMDRRAGMNK